MPVKKQYLGFIEYPKVVKKSRSRKIKKTIRKSRKQLSKSKSRTKKPLFKSRSRKVKSKSRSRKSRSRSDSRKICPKGEIIKKGYITKNGVKVSPTCITDLGKLGKGIKNIPLLRKGLLTRFGYHGHLDKEKRHKALKKAVKEYSAGNVVKKLNAIYVLNRNTNPSLAKIYNSDKKWVQINYETRRSKSKKSTN